MFRSTQTRSPIPMRPRLPPLASTALAITALTLTALADRPYQLLYNPSNSAPRGWYLRIPTTTPRINMLVILRLPTPIARFADERHYLPISIPILKQIAATPGDHVCIRNHIVRINAHPVALALTHDGAGRPLTPWNGCRTLHDHELFLLNLHSPASFDSRYYGPLRDDAVIGQAIPLWTEPPREDEPRKGVPRVGQEKRVQHADGCKELSAHQFSRHALRAPRVVRALTALAPSHFCVPCTPRHARTL